MLNTEKNWYVITGGPSSGKTTVISMLSDMGHSVIHEAARTYIDKEFAKGKTIQEIRKDEKEFQNEILEMKLRTERELGSKNKPNAVFFDRGIPDSESYMQLHNFDVSPTLKTACEQCSYKKIFLLDMLPYKNDYARTETEEERAKLQTLLENSYKKLGFKIVKVPVLPIEMRVDFIIKNL